MPVAARERIGAVAAARNAELEWLGDEEVGAYHFNLDPELVRLRRYRIRASGESGHQQLRYLTVRLSGDGMVLGALVEDE